MSLTFTDGTPAAQIGEIARANGLVIRSINALQRFEQFDAEREAEAIALARYARDCGAEALVLCPTNNRGDKRTAEERHAALVHALKSLKPILADHGIVGLVEPLGFEECAVRRKSQEVRAFEAHSDFVSRIERHYQPSAGVRGVFAAALHALD